MQGVARAALVVLLVLLLDCANHWSRDFFGALEGELEAAFGLSEARYHLLTSVYFLASVPSPLVAGFATRTNFVICYTMMASL